MTNIEKLKRDVEQGSVVAQSVLGICYLLGIDVETDYEAAFKLLSAASKKKAPRAMVNLGLMYERGLYAAMDINEAARLYELGAQAGEFFGCIYIARLKANGAGGTIDVDAALKWYGKAVSQKAQVSECDEELAEAERYLVSHGAAEPALGADAP